MQYIKHQKIQLQMHLISSITQFPYELSHCFTVNTHCAFFYFWWSVSLQQRVNLISKSNIRLIKSLALAGGKPRAITTGSPAVYKLLQANIDNSYSHYTYCTLRLIHTNPLCCCIHTASPSLFIIQQEEKEYLCNDLMASHLHYLNVKYNCLHSKHCCYRNK